MNTNRTIASVPTRSALSLELDALIAEADALDARLADNIAYLDGVIARLEAMNPAAVAGMAAIADLAPAQALEVAAL